MTADERPIDSRVTRLVAAVQEVCDNGGNGSRVAAVKAMITAADPLLRHVDVDHAARQLERKLTEISDGTCSDDDPAATVAFLALQVSDDRPTDESSSLVDRLRSRLRTASEIETLPSPNYLVDGYVVENSLGVLYGKPGGGKSLTMLDWAASIATGSWWFGREVRKGPVLYVVAEGLAGMGQRIRAWKQHRNTYQLDGLHFLAGVVNLLSLPDVIALCTVAAELEPSFIAIDTLGRSMAGGDENSPRDMGMVVDNLTRLQEATGAATWLAHHGTKADGSLRGHTALEGAMDTVVECKGAENRITLSVDKQKDDRRANPLHLHIVEADDSVVLHDRADPNRTDDVLPGKASEVLRALELVALDDGVSASVWSESAVGLKVAKSTFYEHKKTLILRGLVRQIGEGRSARFAVAATDPDPVDDF